MAKKFLTLDIGAANVALAEYEVGAKGALSLVNYGTAALAASLDSGDVATILAPAILEIVREKGIRPGEVAVSVSGQMVFPRFAAIPDVGGEDKFEQNVRYEIEQNVPFPYDDMVCDRQVLGETDQGDKSVMIVAAKIDQIESITDAVASAGFAPTLVSFAPLAVTNALNAIREDENECAIILDIGAKTTSLVITEGTKIYNRSIPIAGTKINQEIAKALGCSEVEAEQLKREKGYVSLGGVVEDDDEVADSIAKVCRAAMTRLQAEISRSVNFYRSQQGGSAPTRLYLTGGSTLLGQMDTFFAESLGVEVAYFNPFEEIEAGPAVDAEALAADAVLLGATAGLAVQASGNADFAINLLPPAIIAERAEKAKIPFIAAAGVILVIALGVMWFSVSRQNDAVVAQKESLESCVGGLQKFKGDIDNANKQVAKVKGEAESFAALLASRSTAVNRLGAMRSALLPGMWIESWQNGLLTVRCWKDRWDAIKKEDGEKNKATGREPSEIVVAKLKGASVINPDGVKIAASSDLGKDALVKQFTVEVKFK